MNQLAEELKEIVGNYTDNYNIFKYKDELNLYIRDIPSPLMYDIMLLAKSLNYGFTIRPTLPQYALQLEFYKIL